MYYPYFRGKQYELITIREMAETMAGSGFCPIIEPVRASLSGLQKALRAVTKANGKAVVIVNPQCGDLQGSQLPLAELLDNDGADLASVSAGILLSPSTTLEGALAQRDSHLGLRPTFVHSGFREGKNLAARLGNPTKEICHVFLDDASTGRLYRRHFEDFTRVLVRDGFRKMNNAKYSDVETEPFSDLHATFEEQHMEGFGDFLVVGKEYTEGGGPAYAVAIHLTFIDPERDDEMGIYHFVSDSRDTPTDPAGKFSQALEKMMSVLADPASHIAETSAISEFRELHARGHFPGLGYVKKLSMNHHVETLARYLGAES